MRTKIQNQGENNSTGKCKGIEGLCEEKICCHHSTIWHFTVEKNLRHTYARAHTHTHTTLDLEKLLLKANHLGLFYVPMCANDIGLEISHVEILASPELLERQTEPDVIGKAAEIVSQKCSC